MANVIFNGPKNPLGTLKTRLGFTLTHFPDEKITFRIPLRKRSILRTVPVHGMIESAVAYLDKRAANDKTCNAYFASLNPSNPTTLREILDRKTLHIYRLGGREDRELDAGFTLGWGPDYAQIGINRIQLTDSGQAAATLLHELAHVAGAPGKDVDPKSTAAEEALRKCGLGRFYTGVKG